MCSEDTGKLIDEEARTILKNSMNSALAILEENREKMIQVAELLLERETITSVDMERICGQRKGRSPTNYSKIIRDVDQTEKEKKEMEKKEKEETESESEIKTEAEAEAENMKE